MIRIEVKNTQDLKDKLGPVYNQVKTYIDKRKSTGFKIRRLPYSIYFTEVKPAFHLSDYETLTFLLVDLKTGETKEHYAGSYDSILNHTAEQLDTGFMLPNDTALIGVTVDGYCLWSLTVISPNLVRQLKD